MSLKFSPLISNCFLNYCDDLNDTYYESFSFQIPSLKQKSQSKHNLNLFRCVCYGTITLLPITFTGTLLKYKFMPLYVVFYQLNISFGVKCILPGPSNKGNLY